MEKIKTKSNENTEIDDMMSKWFNRPLLRLIKCTKNKLEDGFEKYKSIKTNAERMGLLASYDDRLQHYISTIEQLERSNNQLAEEAVKRKENEERIRNCVTHLSHEFKAPLSIISGFLEIIEDGCYEKDPSYYTGIIAREIEKLNTLVLETIELSRQEKRSCDLRLEPFDASSLIQNTVSRFQKQLIDKSLEIELILEKATVVGDAFKIEQVVDNLLSNGIKYSPYGESISIVSRKMDRELKITIKNRGVNIDHNDLKLIWDPFYRGDKLQHMGGDGSGLGLTIVKMILELHQSTYAIANDGNSVVFDFTLELNE